MKLTVVKQERATAAERHKDEDDDAESAVPAIQQNKNVGVHVERTPGLYTIQNISIS